jgi:lysozyme
MAESILKYEAGMPAKQETGSNNKARLGAAIEKLGAAVGRATYQNDIINIRESQKAAEADMIRNTIDPHRKENDAAYAGAVLRNELYKSNKQLQAELDNPASDMYKMDPEKFQEFLNEQAQEFYKMNGESPHAETNAEVFSNFSVAAHAGLVAKHAKTYKELRKTGLGKTAIEALTDLPPGTGEDFDTNTAYLLDQLMPPNQFTAEEQMKAVMAAARASAGAGDRRLLDFANKTMGTDIFMPNEAANAEQAHVEWTRAQEDKKYSELYIKYEGMARMGGITREVWEELHNDPEAVRRFRRGTIDSWYKASHAEHINAMAYKEYEAKFLSETSMGGASEKVRQEVYGNSFRAAMAEARQTGTDEAKLEALGKYAYLLSRQSSPYKELKDNIDATLGRPVYTAEAWANPDLQDALLMFRALKQNLTPQQLSEQVGQEAYLNGLLAEEAMVQAAGDPEKAGIIYVMGQNDKASRPELKTGFTPDARTMSENMAEIVSGDLENSDPNMSGFLGRQVRGSDALQTTQLEYEYRKMYGIAKSRGLSDGAAHEAAKTGVASRTKVYGNELVMTNGVNMATILGMPPGSTAEDLDKSWELFCGDLDLDPDKVRFKLSGNYAIIIGEDGLPVSGKAMIPRALIGERYGQWAADEAEKLSTTSATVRAKDIATRNRNFEHQLNHRHGEVNDDIQILPDGTTIGEFRMANEDERTRIRNLYAEENRGLIGRAFKHIYDAIQETRENPESDPYRQRWKTKSWARDPEGELRDLENDRKALEQASNQGVSPAKQEAAIMQDVSTVKKLVKSHEGFSPRPYKDAKNSMSVGYGRNLTLNPITSEEWRVLGGERDFNKKPITRSEAEYLLENDLANSAKAVDRLFSDTELSGRRREVLINMTYNMGADSVSTFGNMIEAIRAGDYEEAAFQMLYNDRSGSKTLWYQQVGRRAEQLAAIMRKG